ncbi:MAG: MarR family winged helix-turn-helix transcriptional regulator [Candidatus Velthaea sp.]
MPTPSAPSERVRKHLPPEGALQALVVRSIIQLSADIQKRMESFVRPFDLTGSRMGVLFVLFFSQQQLTPSEIGERLFVTRGNMTGLIQGLVNDGLVQRVRRDNDRRAHGLALTSQGRTLVKEYFPHHRRALASLLGGLTPTESLELAKLLQKLRAGMVSPQPPSRA